jgi:pimeloyl-ACP methyl ester carboxylesterase
MRRRPALVAAAAAALLACAPAQAATRGSIARPLDPAKPHGRQIHIGYRWYAPRGTPTGPPIVAVEGGPGYPSTGSRVEYVGIFGPLVRERGLLLVDQRGTGTSAVIRCRELQRFAGRTSGSAFARRAGRCAQAIDRRFGAHASDLFATAYAVDDLAAVIRHLKLGRVDLYGDSYGTFLAQSFMARHPRMLHSVVLDSAYYPRDVDPWYASSGAAARAALEIVSPGSVERLRSLRGVISTRALVDLVQDAGSDPVILRELDAAVRAALAGDDVPLRRLNRQSLAYNHGAGGDAAYFSDGLYMAVNCLDLPQLFDRAASPARRRLQLSLALRDAPDAFQPFTPAQWLTVSGYTQPYDVCLDWPKPVHHRRPVPANAPPLPASVPVLIVGGDLDSLTPLSDAAAAAPDLGANVRIVTLPNTVHVTSEGDNHLYDGMRCARRVIRGFLRGAPEACSIPALHTAAYPRRLAGADPATLAAGPDPGLTARQAATVAAQAFGDATIRLFYVGANGPGLRGGRYTSKGSKLTLHAVRFTQDAPVSGTAGWDANRGELTGTAKIAGLSIGLHWTQAEPLATATIGAATLTLPAP